MKTIIHVNQHNIKANRKEGSDKLPVLTCKTYKENRYGHSVIIRCSSTGKELGRFVYRPDRPLNCGAHVWFETQEKVDVYTRE
jgi:hypothetical protein